VALGRAVDALDVSERDLATSIGRDHLFCLCALAAVLVIQLTA
jgi:hypothetical protein